ncbi:MAG: guanylate kinase [Bacteroidaceae bacterium]|nr:guanylate kinase [Bacteroidaceae bacterium]
MAGKLIIFSAPSGSGKSTIINSLMPREELNLRFSISATTRPPRGQEVHGREYFFWTPEEFRSHIAQGDFIEYEEVYKDRYYGTLFSQVEKQLAEGQNIVLDLDVNGGVRVKEIYAERALSLFIQPPSIEALKQRLEGRATDAPEVIAQRLERAAYELSLAPRFDRTIVNDDLQTAIGEAYDAVRNFVM